MSILFGGFVAKLHSQAAPSFSGLGKPVDLFAMCYPCRWQSSSWSQQSKCIKVMCCVNISFLYCLPSLLPPLPTVYSFLPLSLPPLFSLSFLRSSSGNGIINQIPDGIRRRTRISESKLEGDNKANVLKDSPQPGQSAQGFRQQVKKGGRP